MGLIEKSLQFIQLFQSEVGSRPPLFHFTTVTRGSGWWRGCESSGRGTGRCATIGWCNWFQFFGNQNLIILIESEKRASIKISRNEWRKNRQMDSYLIHSTFPPILLWLEWGAHQIPHVSLPLYIRRTLRGIHKKKSCFKKRWSNSTRLMFHVREGTSCINQCVEWTSEKFNLCWCSCLTSDTCLFPGIIFCYNHEINLLQAITLRKVSKSLLLLTRGSSLPFCPKVC